MHSDKLLIENLHMFWLLRCQRSTYMKTIEQFCSICVVYFFGFVHSFTIKFQPTSRIYPFKFTSIASFGPIYFPFLWGLKFLFFRISTICFCLNRIVIFLYIFLFLLSIKILTFIHKYSLFCLVGWLLVWLFYSYDATFLRHLQEVWRIFLFGTVWINSVFKMKREEEMK